MLPYLVVTMTSFSIMLVPPKSRDWDHIFYIDAPGIREELRNMARRIAKHGYFCLLPDMYYCLGTIRLDIAHRDDAMGAMFRAAVNSLTNAGVVDDTAALLA